MEVKIFNQQDCNYRHITDVVSLIPAASREVDADAKPDVVKALHAITMAVTGANKNLYFSVAEINGVTAGFYGGTLNQFAFEDRLFGQDILAYVKPEYRSTAAMQEMGKQFIDWCFGMGASEVRGLLMNAENQDRLASASKRLGYVEVGKVIVMKRGE